jgi:ABC-type glycerol-3-phosphate transport system permease component
MAKKIKNIKIKESLGDRILNLIIGFILVLVTLAVGYPLVYVISCSFSSSAALEVGSVILWPVDFTLRAYDFVLAYKQVWVGFRNSIMYVVLDVAWSMTTTVLMAYPLSRAYLQGRKFYTMFFYMTTRFGAGLIPLFILKCDMGLYDNILAVLVTGGLAITNMLILRTAINSSIPGELHDAVMIDGANHFQTVFQLVLPLTKATLSVLVLYAIVGQWNEYFNSMIYLQNNQLFPLQLVLRPIMTAATAAEGFQTASQIQASKGLENVRYAMIIIGSAPVLAAYMAIQKYFKGGVMLGSLKG